MKVDFGDLVDSLPGLVVVTGPDGRSKYVNQGWVKYTGLALVDTPDTAWRSAIHAEDRAAFEVFWAMGQSAIGAEVDLRLRRADGEYRWFVFRPSLMSVGSGGDHNWCWFGLDADEGATTDGRQRRLW